MMATLCSFKLLNGKVQKLSNPESSNTAENQSSLKLTVCNDVTLGVVHTASIVKKTSTAEAADDDGYSEHQAGTDDSQPHCHYLPATLHQMQEMRKMFPSFVSSRVKYS
jgi:hypothetical protein